MSMSTREAIRYGVWAGRSNLTLDEALDLKRWAAIIGRYNRAERNNKLTGAGWLDRKDVLCKVQALASRRQLSVYVFSADGDSTAFPRILDVSSEQVVWPDGNNTVKTRAFWTFREGTI